MIEFKTLRYRMVNTDETVVVPAPSSGRRYIKALAVLNTDASSTTVTLSIRNGIPDENRFKLWAITLSSGDKLTDGDEGGEPIEMLMPGEWMTLELAAATSDEETPVVVSFTIADEEGQT